MCCEGSDHAESVKIDKMLFTDTKFLLRQIQEKLLQTSQYTLPKYVDVVHV